MTSETTAQDPRPKTQDPGLDESTLPLQVQEFLRAADRVTAWLIKPNVPIVPRADLARITAAMAQAASRINVAAQRSRSATGCATPGGPRRQPGAGAFPGARALRGMPELRPGARGRGAGTGGQGPGARGTKHGVRTRS